MTYATGKQLVVLHIFTKKTEKTPSRAIETAKDRLRRINVK
ncbi:type II toxin-antitoxin system RelE/ParE family toxin [Alcaligenaceae bacterium LF4-65]|uniref:Type II toxin-antitoxin system RelE/ParE family toxin n=1 Tax=Zwartia hollandica TaxID=324606 RepID=A0A953NCK8_9BURK|nr:type II toxin-antitoxin system RelE/ParE family toxin [Zwartia hollandica]MBZ1351179.1 type II toxin-antitoxin system RelE/ParE family toxin [Zwartia hollandica]